MQSMNQEVNEYEMLYDDNFKTYLNVKRTVQAGSTQFFFPMACYNFMQKHFYLGHRSEEFLFMIAMTATSDPLGVFEIAHGSANCVYVNLRCIFQRLFLCGATKYIILHNHPGSNCAPSREDVELTLKIKKLSDELGFDFADDMVVSVNDYSSFIEEGYFEETDVEKILNMIEAREKMDFEDQLEEARCQEG